MGERLAERIENEIIDAGWPVGKVLGSEADLTERYGVSRAVFREAMRIVDHHGVAEMRRGPGGGLVVVEPDLDAAVRTVSLHLRYLSINPMQLNEARLALELSCVRTATKHLTAASERRLRDHLAEEEAWVVAYEAGKRAPRSSQNFHLLVADLTTNPAMRLFVEILSRVRAPGAVDEGPKATPEQRARQVYSVHHSIAEAIIAGDPDAAERRMRPHLQDLVGYVRPVQRQAEDEPVLD